MAESPDIFARRRLTVGQLRAVADRRFGDAEALVTAGDNARANGAQYLTGLVVEILLKGQLLRLHPRLAVVGPAEVVVADRLVWSLIWRSHDLAEMLEQLPDLRRAVRTRGERAGQPYDRWMAEICGRWTIFARYSPLTSKMADARNWLEQVRLLQEALR